MWRHRPQNCYVYLPVSTRRANRPELRRSRKPREAQSTRLQRHHRAVGPDASIIELPPLSLSSSCLRICSFVQSHDCLGSQSASYLLYNLDFFIYLAYFQSANPSTGPMRSNKTDNAGPGWEAPSGLCLKVVIMKVSAFPPYRPNGAVIGNWQLKFRLTDIFLVI